MFACRVSGDRDQSAALGAVHPYWRGVKGYEVALPLLWCFFFFSFSIPLSFIAQYVHKTRGGECEGCGRISLIKYVGEGVAANQSNRRYLPPALALAFVWSAPLHPPLLCSVLQYKSHAALFSLTHTRTRTHTAAPGGQAGRHVHTRAQILLQPHSAQSRLKGLQHLKLWSKCATFARLPSLCLPFRHFCHLLFLRGTLHLLALALFFFFPPAPPPTSSAADAP